MSHEQWTDCTVSLPLLRTSCLCLTRNCDDLVFNAHLEPNGSGCHYWWVDDDTGCVLPYVRAWKYKGKSVYRRLDQSTTFHVVPSLDRNVFEAMTVHSLPLSS